MILTRLFLNPRSREVQRSLADSHELHRHVLSMFGEVDVAPARAELKVLHRLEPSDGRNVVKLLVQSKLPPDVSRLPATFLDPAAGGDAAASSSLATIFELMRPGARYRFRLRANATRKIDTKSGPDGRRRHGRRVPVRGDEERIAWLVRHLSAAGLRVPTDDLLGPAISIRPEGSVRGGGDLTHESHLFEGVVEVVDADKVREAICAGIGPGKAFGFGLLSLAPIG